MARECPQLGSACTFGICGERGCWLRAHSVAVYAGAVEELRNRASYRNDMLNTSLSVPTHASGSYVAPSHALVLDARRQLFGIGTEMRRAMADAGCEAV